MLESASSRVDPDWVGVSAAVAFEQREWPIVVEAVEDEGRSRDLREDVVSVSSIFCRARLGEEGDAKPLLEVGRTLSSPRRSSSEEESEEMTPSS